MAERQYNTYSVGDELTLIEIDKKTIKGKEYLLLLQQQKPNLIVVGFFEGEQLQIVVNRVIAAELLKTFMKDREAYAKKLEPFIDFSQATTRVKKAK